MKTHEQLVKRMLSDPDIKKAYEDHNREFGIVDRLVVARVKAGFSQAEVAAKMGVSKQHISRFESAQHSPTLNFLIQYATSIGYQLSVRLTKTAKTTK